jgi:aldehyde:ferredoxin oxidoreductase
MLGGYAGKLLRVDLTSGSSSNERLPSEDVLRKYIGGVGLASKILYEELPVDVKPLDPENRIIFMTGPLGGTPAPSSGQCSVCTFNYETGYTLGVAHFHTRFGAMLKYAGYDGIIVQGASTAPVYLWINDGEVELLDASHLWGKDTHETYNLLKNEVGEPEAEAVCIGPAGEAMMKGGAICAGLYHMAAKGGAGSVMGSKKLKAIVVFGTGGIQIADPTKLLELSLGWREAAWAPSSGAAKGVGMAGATKSFYKTKETSQCVAFKNMTDPDSAYEKGQAFMAAAEKCNIRPQAPFSCPVACSYRLEVAEGRWKGLVATVGGGNENLEGASSLMGVADLGNQYWLIDQFDRMGWDSATPGSGIALAFELYENGIITKKDTDGLELKWGNADAVYQLMHKTLKREGIGRVIAEGPKAVAGHFGGDAPQRVIHVKGAGLNMHDWRPYWGVIFSYGVSCTGPCHQGIGVELLQHGEIGYPEVLSGPTAEGKAEAVAKTMKKKLWDDSNGVCWFVSFGGPGVNTYSAESVMAATGWNNLTKEETWTIGERIINLCRVFSVRRGHNPAHDLDYGGRLLEAPRGGPAKGLTFAPHLKRMLTEYYDFMGWDPETGKPNRETLERLDLGYLWKDIAEIEIPVRVEDVVLALDVKQSQGKRRRKGNAAHDSN